MQRIKFRADRDRSTYERLIWLRSGIVEISQIIGKDIPRRPDVLLSNQLESREEGLLRHLYGPGPAWTRDRPAFILFISGTQGRDDSWSTVRGRALFHNEEFIDAFRIDLPSTHE